MCVMQNIFSIVLKNGLVTKLLEWIPYDRFYDIKCIAKGGFGKIYRTKWVDGIISKWDNENKDWERDPRTKDYMMMVLDENASGNNDIDKFIQDTQLSVRYDTKEALEWIPYDRLFNIEYIADGKFGKVYRANWIDGWMPMVGSVRFQF
uniref:Protein kinase domain-containing protein n=1 Tax=Rhizophagus irregularis (strain DAOM 181602 / DAOM 197198 / MUCL 43194) TaxID=747089 RepID=U9T5X2_RHIID